MNNHGPVRKNRSATSIFRNVEGSHSALFEFDKDRLKVEEQSIGKSYYAPATTSARYLKVPSNMFGDIFHSPVEYKEIPTIESNSKELDAIEEECKEDKREPNIKGDASWLLPVRFVEALAKNKVLWDRVESGVDPDEKNLVGDTCADDEDFLSEWKDYWYPVNPNHVEQSNKKKYVPLRARNGALRAVRCLQDTAENFKKKWFNALGTLLKITEKSGSFRKFNRSVDIPMPNGLRFHLHDFAICRFGSRGKAREMLQAGITHIQELKPSCAISASILFVVDVPPDNEWMKLSTNPFGLYSTYVHRDDWNDYMQNLGPTDADRNMTPIRRFRANASDDLKAMTNSVLAKRPTVDPTDLKDKLEATNQDQDMTDDDEVSSNVAEADEDRDDDLTIAQRLFIVPLSDAKRKAAAGKRGQADDQKTVMSNYSASQIAHSMGWCWERASPDSTEYMYRLPNSLYMAEWTHLSAFSYGGLMGFEKGVVDQGKSGQIPLNLVLGSSETNSLMTRYESAWQNLLAKETELMKKYWGSKVNSVPQAYLFLNCNDPMVKLRYDMLDKDKKFSWVEIPLESSDKKIDQGQPQNEQPTMKQMLDLAHHNNSIVYALKYSGYISRSHILDRTDSEQQVEIYPFMRPFYHRAEQHMDNYLFAKMQDLAEAKLESTVVIADKGSQSQTAVGQGFLQISSKKEKSTLKKRKSKVQEFKEEFIQRRGVIRKDNELHTDEEMNDATVNNLYGSTQVDDGMKIEGLASVFNNNSNFANFDNSNMGNMHMGNTDFNELNPSNNLTQFINHNNNSGFGGPFQQVGVSNGTNGNYNTVPSSNMFNNPDVSDNYPFTQTHDDQDDSGFN